MCFFLNLSWRVVSWGKQNYPRYCSNKIHIFTFFKWTLTLCSLALQNRWLKSLTSTIRSQTFNASEEMMLLKMWMLGLCRYVQQFSPRWPLCHSWDICFLVENQVILLLQPFLSSEIFRHIIFTRLDEYLHMCSCKEIKYYSWKLWDHSCAAPASHLPWKQT